MNCDTIFTSGNGEVSIGLKKYYLDSEGNRHPRAGDIDGDYEARAEIGVALNFTPAEWPEDVVDAALKHSFTRKAQEYFQAVLRGEGDVQEATDNFVDTYFKLMRGERERAERVAVDTVESLALKVLQKVLRDKVKEETIPGHVGEAPLTEKGNINFSAWAKRLKSEEHPWYEVALKKARATEKGFE